MNYFAHGMAFVDEPYFLSGTAVPDWLNAADRKTRLRREQVLPWADGSGSPTDRFAAGILRHLEDDDWFHATPAFEHVAGELKNRFREHLKKTNENPRAAFLGHIAAELLLDGVLIAKNPQRLPDYYTALGAVKPAWIAETVARIAGREPASLAWFVERFLEARFLFDYLEAPKLLFRLNQVVRRIKLRPLPLSTAQVIAGGWTVVERHLPDLLPADWISFIPQPEETPR